MKHILPTVLSLASLVLSDLAAQTAPEQPDPKMTTTAEGLRFSYGSVANRAYFVETSMDLESWQFMPYVKSGDGGEKAMGMGGASRVFARLQWTDQAFTEPVEEFDFDGDGYGSMDEIRVLGTTPLEFDSDGDGVGDGQQDTDNDGLEDGFELLVSAFSENDFYRGLGSISLENAYAAASLTGQGSPKITGTGNSSGIVAPLNVWTEWRGIYGHAQPYLVYGGQLEANIGRTSQPNDLVPAIDEYPDPETDYTTTAESYFSSAFFPDESSDAVGSSNWLTSLDPFSVPALGSISASYNSGTGTYGAEFEARKSQIRLVADRPIASDEPPKRVKFLRLKENGSSSHEFIEVVELEIQPGSDRSGTHTFENGNGDEIFVPAQLEVRKKGERIPDDGVLVKNGEVLEFALSKWYFDLGKKFEDIITWQYRQLRGNGAYTEWTNFGAHGKGSRFEHTTTVGGIYQIRIDLGNSVSVAYSRRTSEQKSGRPPFGPGVAGDNESIGVCDTIDQINLCREIQKFYDSNAYDSLNVLPAKYGFPSYPIGTLRCNIYVAHMGNSKGLEVPKINGFLNEYPPIANEWAGIEFTYTNPLDDKPGTYFIHRWPLLGENIDPQPGWVIAHPSPNGSGHCAITDYDGGGLGAGVSGTVNKNFSDFYDGTSRYRKYSPN